MEEQAKQALSQLLERAVQGVDAAVEFSQAQVPDVVEQLLMWHMVQSVLLFATGILISLSGIYAFRAARAKARQARIDYENGEKWTRFSSSGSGLTSHEFDFVVVPLRILSIIPLPVGVLFSVLNLDWLQILIAPKLYLLEYAAQLVK